MLQIRVSAIGTVVCEDTAEPVPGEGEAIVEVRSVGICGSDMHVFKGENPIIKPPVVPGHEFGGVVRIVMSRNGSSFQVGDKVSVFPFVNCMKCYYCLKGQEHLCDNQTAFDGYLMDGAMKERIAVPLDNLVKLPDSFDIRYGALAEPLAVALHAAGAIRESNVLVLGSGPVGLFIQQVCKANGNKVIARDLEEYALAKSRRMGTDLALDFRDKEITDKIAAFASRLDIAVDCVVNEDSLRLAMNTLKKGGKLITVGVPKGYVPLDMVQILIHELTVGGSYLYTKEEFRQG